MVKSCVSALKKTEETVFPSFRII
uniref:Uncharacterized protein n=1 Tax=Anguilla anguilla TaxID=7936 RepID=A0A0E9R7D1_ANGAN